MRGQREGEAPFKKLEDGDGDDKEVADKAESSTSPIKISSKKRLGYGRNKLQRRKRLMKLAEKWSNNDNVIDEIVQEQDEIRERLSVNFESMQKLFSLNPLVLTLS